MGPVRGISVVFCLRHPGFHARSVAMRAASIIPVLLLIGLLTPAWARADQLILNDGTVVEGTILSQGEKYWVKGTDGKSKIIQKSDVKKYVTGAAAATPATGTPAAATPGPIGGSGDFNATKRKA